MGLLAVLGVAPTTLAAPAAAQEGEVRFTVRPAHPDPDRDSRSVSWLLHRAEPGQTVRDAVEVENLGTLPVTLDLYPADAVTTPSGEFGLEPPEAPDDGVAGWVRLSRTRVRLLPGEERSVHLRVRVPEDASPGDHPGAVVARTVRSVRPGPIRTLLAVGTRLYVRVPGRLVTDLRVRNVRAEMEGERPTFFLDIENAGNTLLEVRGRYELEGFFGLDRDTGLVPGTMTLVPGARVVRVVGHPHRLLGGDYGARFTLTANSDETITEAITFSAGFPWRVALVVTLALVAVVGLVLAATRILRARTAPGRLAGPAHAGPRLR
jgi:hypothetical protein